MGGLLSGKRITLWAAVAVLIVAGVLPLCWMIAGSLGDTGNYTSTLGNSQTWRLFGRSLVLAALTTALAGLGGLTLGILLAKTDLPMRALFVAVFSVPLLFPPYVFAVGWFEVLGRGGLLARWADVPGYAAGRWLFALPGATLVLSTAFLPIVLLLTIAFVRGVNSNLEDAARLCCGWPAVIRKVTIPLAMPGFVLALVVVFLLTMGEYGAPSFLRVDVFPVASFTQFTAFYNFGAATAAALPLVLVTLLGLAVEHRVLKEKLFQFGWAGKPHAGRIPLRRTRTALFLLVAAAAVILVGVPLGAITWRGLSTAALSEAVERAGASALRSVAYSGVSATALSILGFFLAYLIHRRAVRGWRWVDAVLLFLFTLPGTVVGIGLIALWNRRQTNFIYATPVILWIGYIGAYAALSTRTILAGFAQMPAHAEEAAEVFGAGWARRVYGILAPLLWPSILVGWAVAFLFCLRDVNLSLLLSPAGHETLTARSMTLMANGSPELIAALCLLLIALSVVPLGVLFAAWKLGSKV